MTTRVTARKDVLIADGIDFYRRMLSELMRGQGYHVTEADSAEETLHRIEQDRPDLLIIDLHLPPRGGRRLLEQAKEQHLAIPRVVALAQTFYDESENEHLRTLGVGASVTRSAPIDDLLAAVRVSLFPEAKDLRRAPRAQVHVPVSYRLIGEDGEVTVDLATHSFNLSADGMFLVATTLAPPCPGTRIHLRFWLPAASEIIESDGVVIWSNQAGGRVNELYPPGMGVMFLGLRRDFVAVINEYVCERTMNPFRYGG